MFGSATVTTLLAAAVAWVVLRSKFPGRRLLDVLTFLPHAVPSVVLALALIYVYLTFDFIPIYGTSLIILVGFVTNYLPFSTRTLSASIIQIHKELEEAAYISGARPWRTMLKIFVPLLMPALAGVWLWVILHAVRFAGTPLMLAEGAKNQVLAILIWNMWDWGHIGGVAAIGTLMIIALLALTLGVRLFGFNRRQEIQVGG
jgi:iron(III) transport system permease protein